MKKAVLMILLLVLTSGLVGCPHWWHRGDDRHGDHGGGHGNHHERWR